MALAATMLVVLSWLLARLIWLPFLFGLFFFLVAGLLVGSVAFRLARASRPVSGSVILRSALLIAVLTVFASVCFEYRHFASTVGDPPRFADARNAALSKEASLHELHRRIAGEFGAAMKAHYSPGGVLGYVRWTLGATHLDLTVDGDTERVLSDHAGFLWLIRTLMSVALVAAGLWSSLESLRSAEPVRNVLLPGEPYLEDDE